MRIKIPPEDYSPEVQSPSGSEKITVFSPVEREVSAPVGI